MRIAPLQRGRVSSVAIIFGLFVLASVVSVDVVVATHDPVTQLTQSEKSSLATDVNVEPKSTPSPNGRSKEKRKGKSFQMRRQTVLDFLGQEFPELQKSLLNSEEKSKGKFRNAVSRLETDVTRLRNVEKRNPAKFELLVDQWKLKTQIEITIAKYAKKESDQQLEERLSPLAEQILDIRKSILKLEQQSMVEKLSNIERRILHYESNGERVLERNIRSFQRSADKIRGKQKERQAAKAKANTGREPSEEKP